jgi:hypothetical protein
VPKSFSTRRWVPAAAFLFAASMSLGMANAPVEESGILVSSDGVTFSRSLSGSLFDDLAHVVPTESTTSDLWIRNPSSSPATVRISIDDLALGPGAFADNLTLTSLVERTGTTRAATLRQLHECNVIVAAETLPGKGILKVHFTATLGDLHGLAGQNEGAPIVLRIETRDSEAGGFSSTPCDEPTRAVTGSGEALAGTGSDASAQMTAGGVLLISGILLVVAHRRRARSVR